MNERNGHGLERLPLEMHACFSKPVTSIVPIAGLSGGTNAVQLHDEFVPSLS